LFVTSQGSAYARFRRALDSQNATVAYAAATELDFVGLSDALELVLRVVEDPRRFRRAALRWHARYCAEVQDVGFEEAQAVVACLAGLAGRQPKAAAEALAALVHRRGSKQAGEALLR
jgi:sulfite reductase beta subunit-like hemoprotein